jgi:hypothetical protein
VGRRRHSTRPQQPVPHRAPVPDARHVQVWLRRQDGQRAARRDARAPPQLRQLADGAAQLGPPVEQVVPEHAGDACDTRTQHAQQADPSHGAVAVAGAAAAGGPTRVRHDVGIAQPHVLRNAGRRVSTARTCSLRLGSNTARSGRQPSHVCCWCSQGQASAAPRPTSAGKGQWFCVLPVSWFSTNVTARPGHQPSRPGALP